MSRLLATAGILCGLVALGAFVAVFTFGYLACFTSGGRAEHYFNAAMVSVFLCLIAGAGAAGLLVMADS